MLVCGTLLLLTSTAPWTPPELGPGASATDGARDAAEVMPPLGNEFADGSIAASDSLREPETAVSEQAAGLEAALPPAEPAVMAHEKTAAAAEQAAAAAAGLLPAPEPLTARRTSERVREVAAVMVEEAEPDRGEPPSSTPYFARAALAEARAGLVIAASATEPFDLATDVPPRAVETFEPDALPLESEVPAKAIEAALSAPPELEVAELVPPPMPRRRPELPEPAAVAAAPVPEPEDAPEIETASATAPARERPVAQAAPQTQTQTQARTGPSGGLFGFFNPAKPMALAPPDQPVAAAKPATARPSSRAYASQVWSRLARHKPRAGQRGSASVTFTIGDMGVLRGAQIARSSGSSRIDQLALQTVRSAAPFPAPPAGAVSYTIRIDFP